VKGALKHYSRQCEILLRILRKHKTLHQDKFDEIFSNYKIVIDTKCPQSEWNLPHGKRMIYQSKSRFGFASAFSGKKPFLGSLNQPGDWAKWLELLQIMITDNQINFTGKLPNVVYSLNEATGD